MGWSVIMVSFVSGTGYIAIVVLQTIRCTALAIRVERVRESGLLGGVDGQIVVVLDLNPSDDIVALEGIERGKPGAGVLIALGLVEVVCDGNQLGLSKVVGELLTTSGGPTAGSADPGLLQRNEVIDVEVSSQVGGGVIVG